VLVLGTRTYFALSRLSEDFPAKYTCWDAATGSACAGFTPSSSRRTVAPYTLRQDPFEPTCIWEVGDSGVFEVFHRDTGKIGWC